MRAHCFQINVAFKNKFLLVNERDLLVFTTCVNRTRSDVLRSVMCIGLPDSYRSLRCTVSVEGGANFLNKNDAYATPSVVNG